MPPAEPSNRSVLTNSPPAPQRTRHVKARAIEVLTLDGQVHAVAAHLEHEIPVQVVTGHDAWDNELRRVDQVPATRFRTGCGLGFDAMHEPHAHSDWEHIGKDAGRWAQGKRPDCEACLAWVVAQGVREG